MLRDVGLVFDQLVLEQVVARHAELRDLGFKGASVPGAAKGGTSSLSREDSF